MAERIHFFQAYGVELEYMVVDRESLAVRPVVDELLRRAATLPGAAADDEGSPGWPGSVELGDVTWSNELALHVLEFKTSRPAPSLAGLAARFAEHVRLANELLAPMGCVLLPTGMHPLMDPAREFRVWPHGFSEVYETFNRIFDCRGHGWANLQSAHLNLPFATDDGEGSEFGRLHAAVRAVMPILPALASSSPLMEGRETGLMDTRLEVYRTNSAKVPEATGLVVPEAVFTRADYEREIFQRIYRAYEPLDPGGVLRDEWANSRGAIARFGRGTIEVRVLDVQECPAADLAVCAAVSGVVRALAEGRVTPLAELRRLEVKPLHAILLDVIRDAERAVIRDGTYLRALGWKQDRATAGELWRALVDGVPRDDAGVRESRAALETILNEGCLARRIANRLGNDVGEKRVRDVYRELSVCLADNRMFTA